jgi:hypothetical protein
VPQITLTCWAWAVLASKSAHAMKVFFMWVVSLDLKKMKIIRK